MVNSRRKGMALEREAECMLKEKGYLTFRVRGSTTFNRNVDIFGEFDILAVKAGMKRWIQIKANKSIPRRKLFEWAKMKKEHFNETDSFEWWTYWNRGRRKGKSGWEITSIH